MASNSPAELMNMPLSPESTAQANAANCKLFIGGLSYETTDESLMNYFSQFGQVFSASVLRDQDTNRSRGFGFVTFTSPESAQRALGQHHHMVDGRKVESKLAVPRKRTDSSNGGEDLSAMQLPSASVNVRHPANNTARATPTPTSARSSPLIFSPNTTATSTTTTGLSRESVSPPPSNSDIIPNKIFVGGLRYATAPEVLRSLFEEFGEVETAQIIFNRDTKKSRGFGFVVFRDPVSVERVLVRQRTNPIVIEGKQVEVKTCVARQDSSASMSGASSPRAIPQTPIVTRSDSFSSMTSGASVQRVSATPVRPPSAALFNSLPPPPALPSTAWSRTSPVQFEIGDVPIQIGGPGDGRRASFASSSVRSSSPFTSAVPITADPLDLPTNLLHRPQFYSPQPQTRESPSVFFPGSRMPGFNGTNGNLNLGVTVSPGPGLPAPPQGRNRKEDDWLQGRVGGLGNPGEVSGMGFQPPSTSAFVRPHTEGNHDRGLFDMNSFLGTSLMNSPSAAARGPSPATTGGGPLGGSDPSLYRRPVQVGLTSQTSVFRPLTTQTTQDTLPSSMLSPPRTVVRSPMEQSSPGMSLAFSPFPTTTGSIW